MFIELEDKKVNLDNIDYFEKVTHAEQPAIAFFFTKGRKNIMTFATEKMRDKKFNQLGN